MNNDKRPLWRVIVDWTLMTILIGVLVYSLYIKMTGTCPPCPTMTPNYWLR